MKPWKFFPGEQYQFNFGLGFFRDIPAEMIPLGGWYSCDGFHVVNNKMETYLGWVPFSVTTISNGNYLFQFIHPVTKVKYLLAGSDIKLYLYNEGTTDFDDLGVTFATENNDRWLSTVLNSLLYLTNNKDKIQIFNGSTLSDLSGDAQTPSGAKFMITLANRLVVANLLEGATRYPHKLRSCQVDDPTIWVPDVNNNEAFYINLDDGYGDITGLAKLGEQRAIIYYEKAIYGMQYIGLPEIYSFSRLVSDVGLAYPYSLVATVDRHFGISDKGFFVFDGQQIRDIGKGKVWNYFKDDLYSVDPNSVYGFAHPTLPEIWWVYARQTTGMPNYDRAIIYNYETDGWFHRDTFPHNALAFGKDLGEKSWSATSGNWEDSVDYWVSALYTDNLPVLLSIYDAKVQIHNTRDIVGTLLNRRLETGHLQPLGETINAFASDVRVDIERLESNSAIQLALSADSKQENPGFFATIARELGDTLQRITGLRMYGKVFKVVINTQSLCRLVKFGLNVKSAGNR